MDRHEGIWAVQRPDQKDLLFVNDNVNVGFSLFITISKGVVS